MGADAGISNDLFGAPRDSLRNLSSSTDLDRKKDQQKTEIPTKEEEADGEEKDMRNKHIKGML